MVQEFHVIRCVTCETFQVQQVKKATTRWSCRVCGEKQSLLKEFGRGSAADCRRHVQKLNAARGATLEEEEQNTWSLWGQEDEDEASEEDDQLTQRQTSRWSKYLDGPVEAEPEKKQEEGAVLMDRQQLHGNNAMNWKRKREAADQSDQPEKQSSSTRTTTLNQSRPRTSDLNQSSPSRMTSPILGSVSSSEPCVSGRSQLKSEVGDIVSRPHPLRPASMFVTEEDFSIDDEEFLINHFQTDESV